MRAVALSLLLALSAGVGAKVEVLEFASAEQEARYRSLIAELRCLVCQNQNLADSDADLARDLRQKTYEMIRAGASDAEITAFMTERYGDFVLYRPPLQLTTALLWLGPFLLLGIGVAVLVVVARRRRTAIDAPVTEDARLQARRLLGGGDGETTP